MSGKTEVTNNGIGAMGLLGVILVTLKLVGIESLAEVSWWWVTAPFWGPAAILLSIAAACLIVALILKAFGK